MTSASATDVPAILLSVFTNISECMQKNASLIQKAINDGAFDAVAADAPAEAPSGKKKRGRPKTKGGGDDPQKPKRTKSGYILYAEEERKTMMTETAMASLTPKEIMTELGKRWSGLGVDGKKVWQDKAQVLKAEAVAAFSTAADAAATAAAAAATAAVATAAAAPAAETSTAAAEAEAAAEKKRRKAAKKALKQAAASAGQTPDAAGVTAAIASAAPAVAATPSEKPAVSEKKKKKKADKESRKQNQSPAAATSSA